MARLGSVNGASVKKGIKKESIGHEMKKQMKNALVWVL